MITGFLGGLGMGEGYLLSDGWIYGCPRTGEGCYLMGAWMGHGDGKGLGDMRGDGMALMGWADIFRGVGLGWVGFFGVLLLGSVSFFKCVATGQLIFLVCYYCWLASLRVSTRWAPLISAALSVCVSSSSARFAAAFGGLFSGMYGCCVCDWVPWEEVRGVGAFADRQLRVHAMFMLGFRVEFRTVPSILTNLDG